MENQLSKLKELVNNQRKIITITSGKGGVGKSNFVANTALALRKLGKTVAIFDADLSLGNVDVLYGIRPRFNLMHFLAGEKEFADIMVKGPDDVYIIPAASGVREMSNLSENDKNRLIYHMKMIEERFDIILVDTASGMSDNVMGFLFASEDIIVVTTPDPTAITDAYAMIKVLNAESPGIKLKLVVNMVNSRRDGAEVADKLNLVVRKFLDSSIEYFGYVFYDEKLKNAVREQMPVFLKYPQSLSSGCFKTIAEKIVKSGNKKVSGKIGFFEKALQFLGRKQ